MDGTPIYDIKPYLPYSDCKPEAVGGFASRPKEASLAVDIPERWKALIPEGLLPRADWGAGPGPQALLSTGSGPDLHHGVWRSGGKVSGRGGYPECVPNIPEEILIKF